MNSQNAFVARTTKMRTLLALAFIIALFVVTRCAAQNLQAGISVNLPIVSNATPVPDADKEDALIVTVTENGDTYLGVDAITSDALADKTQTRGRLSSGEEGLHQGGRSRPVLRRRESSECRA